MDSPSTNSLIAASIRRNRSTFSNGDITVRVEEPEFEVERTSPTVAPQRTHLRDGSMVSLSMVTPGGFSTPHSPTLDRFMLEASTPNGSAEHMRIGDLETDTRDPNSLHDTDIAIETPHHSSHLPTNKTADTGSYAPRRVPHLPPLMVPSMRQGTASQLPALPPITATTVHSPFQQQSHAGSTGENNIHHQGWLAKPVPQPDILIPRLVLQVPAEPAPDQPQPTVVGDHKDNAEDDDNDNDDDDELKTEVFDDDDGRDDETSSVQSTDDIEQQQQHRRTRREHQSWNGGSSSGGSSGSGDGNNNNNSSSSSSSSRAKLAKYFQFLSMRSIKRGADSLRRSLSSISNYNIAKKQQQQQHSTQHHNTSIDNTNTATTMVFSVSPQDECASDVSSPNVLRTVRSQRSITMTMMDDMRAEDILPTSPVASEAPPIQQQQQHQLPQPLLSIAAAAAAAIPTTTAVDDSNSLGRECRASLSSLSSGGGGGGGGG